MSRELSRATLGMHNREEVKRSGNIASFRPGRYQRSAADKSKDTEVVCQYALLNEIITFCRICSHITRVCNNLPSALRFSVHMKILNVE